MRDFASVVEALESFSEDFSPEEVIEWAANAFGDGLVVQTSGGIQAAVMLKLVTSMIPNVKVVFVNTGFLPTETVDYMETLREELNLNLTVASPELTPQELEAQYGKLWETDHELYGKITKVAPMNRALQELGATAVLAGLRHEQTSTRAGLSKISYDMGSHLFKLLPILHWTKADVQQYQQEMMLPEHPLRAKGYASIGDAHSSRAMLPGEDERSTRFGGKTQECGLHTQTLCREQVLTQFQVKTPVLPDGYVLFAKRDCKYCEAAKGLLNTLFYDFIVKDTADASVRGLMYRLVPDAKTVPQIFFNNKHVGGFTELHCQLDVQGSADDWVREHQLSSQSIQ